MTTARAWRPCSSFARLLESVKPAEGLEMRLVFFVNEELPWFATEKMGSLVHAGGLAREGWKSSRCSPSRPSAGTAMRRAASANPFPFNLLYPSTGDFIAFVANPRSRSLLHRVIARSDATRPFPRRAQWGWNRSQE